MGYANINFAVVGKLWPQSLSLMLLWFCGRLTFKNLANQEHSVLVFLRLKLEQKTVKLIFEN